MSLDSLYHATNKRLSEAQEMLAALASNKMSMDGDSITHKNREIAARIEHIMRFEIFETFYQSQNYYRFEITFFSNCERLDVLVQKEPPYRRQNSKIKVDQLKYDVKHLQSSFQNHQVSF